MHKALWFLLKLDFRGSLRGLRSIFTSWKRMTLLLFILLLIGMMIFARSVQSEEVSGNRFGAGMPFWAFVYLAASWLTASSDRGLVMRPAEIHFLFGGPFRNRDIITLHLIRLLIRSFVSALVLSLVGIAYLQSVLGGLVGLWFLLAVSLLVGMIVSLMARSAHGKAPVVLRRVLTCVVVGLIFIQVAESIQMLRQRGVPIQISQIAATAPQTSVGCYILPPIEWMFRPMASNDFLKESLPLLPTRIPVVVLLIAAVYFLGSDFSEASAMRTDQAMARRASALRSGSVSGTSRIARRLTLPVPKWRLGGVAAIGWWQTLNLLRILPRYFAFTAVVMGLLIIVPAMVNRQSLSGTNGVAWLSGLSLYGDFLLLLQLPVGFMGPPAQREMLKALPVANWRIVVGQLIGPLVPVIAIHSVTTLLFALVFPIPWPLLVCTSIALLPAAFVVIANLNTLGIWGIIQPRALQQRDVLAAGRAMASVWLFGILMIPAVLLAVATGLALEFSTGPWLPEYCGLILGCGIGCSIASLGYIYLIVRTFERWQPSAGDRGDDEREHDH
jgi:Putative ABC exporter